jgi:hypothetical protein
VFWTVALLVLRLIPPRPDWESLVQRPGFAATLVASIVLLSLVVKGGMPVIFGVRPMYLPLETSIWVALRSPRTDVGHAVLAAWLVLALTRCWRPERTWIDRLGRALGVFWLVMIVVNVLR